MTKIVYIPKKNQYRITHNGYVLYVDFDYLFAALNEKLLRDCCKPIAEQEA